MYGYNDNVYNSQVTNTIGSMNMDRSFDFKNGITAVIESFRGAAQMDPVDDLLRIFKSDRNKETYKQQLLGDVLNESFDDPYYNNLGGKLEQLFENTALEYVRESAGVGNMQPITGLTPFILKKNYLTCHGKDVVMTEVPDSPIIRTAFERKFLKDRQKNKYYIPEIFYDDSYKEVMAKTKGKAITDKWFAINGTEVDIIRESGGTLEGNDSVSFNFAVEALKIEAGTEEASNIVTVEGLDIQPNFADAGMFNYRIEVEGVTDTLFGQLDSYKGTVSVACASGKIKEVRFGGNLSNENNLETLELDREREHKEWKIGDGAKLNTGFTLEKIKDYDALFNINVTAEIVSDMADVLTQLEDSDIFGFLDASFTKWAKKKNLPFGYKDGFVESARFDCNPPSGIFKTQSEWIGQELKFTMERLLSRLKHKLKTTDVMYVVYGNPDNIELLNTDVNWVVDSDTKIGGIQLDYKFGVTVFNGHRVHVVSSMKVPQSKGLRTVLYPTTKETITFKHYKYSLNIENTYRNPNSPLIPNIMGTSRNLTTELLPVQGQLELTGTEFGAI